MIESIYKESNPIILTAGASYLDIDAYACMAAMAELYKLRGREAVAYSRAVTNYSVTPSLACQTQVLRELPDAEWEKTGEYVIVDVSDPEYLVQSVPLDRVAAVYDHHVGFEDYWQNRIGGNAHIEFVGAAATLIYREWKRAGLQHLMTAESARLLTAAILDNTLNLTSANTTAEDRDAFRDLCKLAGVTESWRETYFSEVQQAVEADLKNALMGDLKTVRGNPVLPPMIAQLCVWDADSVLGRMAQIRHWFRGLPEAWMINLIELKHRRNYFLCDDEHYQNKLETTFSVRFSDGIAQTERSYLRKELIRNTINK